MDRRQSSSTMMSLAAAVTSVVGYFRPMIGVLGRVSDLLLQREVWIRLHNAGEGRPPFKIIVRQRADVYDIVSASLRELYGGPNGLQLFCRLYAHPPDHTRLRHHSHDTKVRVIVRGNTYERPLLLWIDMAAAKKVHDAEEASTDPGAVVEQVATPPQPEFVSIPQPGKSGTVAGTQSDAATPTHPVANDAAANAKPQQTSGPRVAG
jgi:hypothetical protein